MTSGMTPFEAFDLEIWGLRNAADRDRTVPILLDFAVRQRDHSLADAIEATLQIYRRYRARYKRNFPVTSKVSMLVPEVEAFSNGLQVHDRDARVELPGHDGTQIFLIDTDLFRVGGDGAPEYPWRPPTATDSTDDSGLDSGQDAAVAWTLAVERVATIGVHIGFFGPGRTADRSGAFLCRVRGGAPGLAPASPLTRDNAWYDVRLHSGLTEDERLAVLAEILGNIFLGHAPQVWSGDKAWTNRDALLPDAPATSHWWIAPESRTASRPPGLPDPLLYATSRSFTDMEARQAMLAGVIGMARAGLLPHLPSGRRLGAPGQIAKDMRWVPVLQAAERIEALLTGAMPQPVAVPPRARSGSGLDRP
ncbi:hypothetical protein [Corynebacterium terpenotabidum]|uniref:Uncharacterized protein n=1 Tax=Corynebacterium terpenotabidum Y-11 TaxID=1200352 RepID=S4XIF6_9CORY|nr:hypothetical protein [Corynebacterium terpenotabidum]AGP30398.1 hypothetical protein A606_03735 [Corynebacterium terpenotabidum Y-11]